MAVAQTQTSLVTSITIHATAANSQRNIIGQINKITPHETRTITDSFVIGNSPPDIPFELIPGVVTGRTLTATFVSLYVQNALQAFGRDDQTALMASLADQNSPVDIEISLLNPNNGKTKTTTYAGCYMNDYSPNYDITSNDIRILESCTFTYKTVSTTTFQ